MARSAAGQLRIDYGATSVITNPASGVTLLLDHAKQEFRAIPAPPGVTPPQLKPPAIPGMPGAPPIPTSQNAVKDLGVKIVQGIEVHGHQITLPPLTPPKPPAPPAVPALPGAPKVAAAVAAPAQLPTIAEVWVSTKLQMPVLTRISGSFGQQMCHCKNTVAGEPPPTAFQVPPNYKQVGLPSAPTPPAPPAVPGMPAAPAMPGMPAMPSMPAAPAMPAAPSMPSAPAVPAAPAAPQVPSMLTPPKPPTFKF